MPLTENLSECYLKCCKLYICSNIMAIKNYLSIKYFIESRLQNAIVLLICGFLVLGNYGNLEATETLRQKADSKLEAYFAMVNFFNPSEGPYVETYLSFYGPSIAFVTKENNALQGCIEVTYIFSQKNEVVTYKKYNVLSPEVFDTSGVYFSFLDQQRIKLANGDYTLDIVLRDTNSLATPLKFTQPVSVNFNEEALAFSDIELVESYKKTEKANMFTKSGLDIIPFVSSFYAEDQSNLRFYVELYNSHLSLGSDEKFLVKYYIRKYESKRTLDNYVGYVRKETAPVNVIFKELDITKLASGNYELVLEARDRNNSLLNESTLFFQRSNPSLQFELEDLISMSVEGTFVSKFNSIDTLKEYVRSCRPISDEMEKNFEKNQLDSINLSMLKSYFLNFWIKRNEVNPEQAWREYKESVQEVQKAYGTSIRRGYDTDRGRIYLKHGPPNSVVSRINEAETYPYEIWHYYKIDVRSDARFIFYNPDLISNDYELLHSNVYNEIRDYRWQVRLARRTNAIQDVDDGAIMRSFGNEAENLFNTPR